MFSIFLYKGVVINRVKDLPLDDRPREKLYKYGAESLSDSELLAILLRTGSKNFSVIELAQNLIKENNNLVGLVNKSVDELVKIKGIGKDKAVTLLAAFEIAKRIQVQSKWLLDKKITSPDEFAEMLIPMLKNENVEKFYIACLNRANKLITLKKISEGSLHQSIVQPRDVFKIALDTDASSIILVHNHPSGNAEPSEADKKITNKLKKIGELFEIPVLDHIIIAGNNYYSFVEKKLL